ncbi:peroxynitrite isomerase THAP4-like [Aptenodytes patagonicus]|uniref:peroxynitrite isomerase THAP4-like n=1 Tax=Aptenodytes patagonicus TaxID=9234 RepID=UPI003FA12A31
MSPVPGQVMVAEATGVGRSQQAHPSCTAEARVETAVVFNAFHPDTRKPMHRECGFIRLKPDTNKVAFISAQNTGLVEVEEGEVNGQELSIASHSIARISFAKKPHVEQITRKFRLNSDGKLEQTVSMATTTQPMTQHLHITYKKVTP